ncbi:MAG TPA: AMP-binding protein, partial [Gaiellaceae bacterium]|nr:AMP-binding protein [Gaiellaceae bacterium]
LDRFRSPRLRRLVSTGEYLEPEVIEAFEERWGMTIHDGYGQTETNIFIANGAESGFRPGSLGRALPGHHVGIIDAEGNELPVGIEGDLAVRGRPPALFAGYWESPDETKRAFRGDWYLTGDVAKADEDGFFWFIGRAEDVISSSGRTFGPYDVERVLREHQAIAASAVVGLRDLQRGGQFVRAYVVPARGGPGSAELEAELRQFVGEALPEQQIPREIVFVDELPTVRDRVSRRLLREHPVGGRPLWDQSPTSDPETEHPPVATEPSPSPVQAEAVPVVDLEPTAGEAPEPAPQQVVPSVPAEQVVEPVPIRSDEPAPLVTPEPAVPLEPVTEVPPEPSQIEPVAEASPLPEPEPEHVPAPILVPEPEPGPEPAPIIPELEPAAEATPVSYPEPPEALPEPEYSVASDPSPLPDYVIEPSELEPPEPPVRPAPTTEPVVSVVPEPLPDFIIPPGTSPDPPPPVPALGLEPEDEEDLGPLPDYVVDPSRPPEPPPREPEPVEPPPMPTPPVEAAGNPDAGNSSGLNFPPAASFPDLRSEDGEPGFGRDAQRTPRGRPAAGSAGSKRVRSREAEPGDESPEVGWMLGLSNRLSAYSLGDEEASPGDEPSDDEPDDADTAS